MPTATRTAPPPRAVVVLGAVYAVGLVLLVLGPVGAQLNALTVRMYTVWTYTLHGPVALRPGDFGFALNVLLFVPVGALVVLVTRWPWWLAALVAVLVSAGVELVQLLPLLDRMADPGDVLSNGLGGLVGALLATRFSRVRRPS